MSVLRLVIRTPSTTCIACNVFTTTITWYPVYHCLCYLARPPYSWTRVCAVPAYWCRYRSPLWSIIEAFFFLLSYFRVPRCSRVSKLLASMTLRTSIFASFLSIVLSCSRCVLHWGIGLIVASMVCGGCCERYPESQRSVRGEVAARRNQLRSFIYYRIRYN